MENAEGQKRFALFVWDDDTLYLHDLGYYYNSDTAASTARHVLAEDHPKFSEENNPNWLVGEYDSLVIK